MHEEDTGSTNRVAWEVGGGGDSAVASPKEIWTPREKMNFPY